MKDSKADDAGLLLNAELHVASEGLPGISDFTARVIDCCQEEVTFQWLKKRIKKKIEQESVQKVVVVDISHLMESCDSEEMPSDIEDLQAQGYTFLLATVDNNGQVSEVEAIEDLNDTIDAKVDQFINRTGEGMVVIER